MIQRWDIKIHYADGAAEVVKDVRANTDSMAVDVAILCRRDAHRQIKSILKRLAGGRLGVVEEGGAA